MPEEQAYFAGLDVGGSTIKSILIDSDANQVGEMVEVRSHADESYLKTFEQLKLSLSKLLEQTGLSGDAVKAIGLDVPAPCAKGVIWGPANLAADWLHTNIQEELSKAMGKTVYMTNDGNAAAYGEYVMRPGIDTGLFLVAPGTGLGGGLVLPGGYLYEGANGIALEIGDASVAQLEDGEFPADGGGRVGNIEAWVSLIAIRRQLGKALEKPENAEHPLAKMDISIKEKAFKLREFMEEGDALAKSIFQRQANVLGFFLGDQVSQIDPGLIVIGGGIADMSFRDWYLDEVKVGFADRALPFYQNSPIPPHHPTTKFEWAIGGDAAAAVGVSRRAMESV